eukprot:PITA_24018
MKYGVNHEFRYLVYLYKWFLIRVVKDCPENCTIGDGEQVAVGGYTASDLLDVDRYITSPIESRIEKCKLRTVDGLEILLMGTIDDQCTYENGFPFQVIHLFMHGFPFNWNHIVNICKGQPNSNIAPLLARKTDESVSKECPVVQVDDTGAGKLGSLEPEEYFSRVVSPRESSVRSTKRVRCDSQLYRSSKESKYGKLSTESKPKMHFTGVGSQENSNILKESEANLCLGASSKSIEKEGLMPHPRLSDMDIHGQINHKDKLTDLSSELGKTKPLNFSVSHIVKKPVQNDNKIMKGYNLRRTRGTEELKKQMDSGTSLDEAKFIIENMKFEDTNENTSARFTNSEDYADCRLHNQEVEQSPLTNEHLEQSSNICSRLGEQTQEIQTPISECAKLNTKKTSSKNVFSQASRNLLCDDGTVKDGIESNSDGKDTTYSKKSHQKIIPTRPLHEVSKIYSQFPLDPDFLEFGSKKTRTGTDGKAQAEEDSLADVGFVQLQKNVSFHSAESKSLLPESSHNNKIIGSEKDVNKSKTKRKGRGKRRTTIRHTNPFPAVVEGLVCGEKMKDDVNLKFDDIDATSNGDPNLVACEIDNDTLAEHDTEIGDNCLKENVDGDKGRLQTRKHGTLENTGTDGKAQAEEDVNKSKTKRKGRGKRRTTIRHTNPFPAVLEGLVCGEKMKDDVNLKFDDIDATSNGDPNLVDCEIDNDTLAEHDTEIGDNCLKENVDGDKGRLQTRKHGTLENTGTDGKAQAEEDNLTDVGFVQLQKNVSFHSGQTKPFLPGNSHINNNVMGSEKDVNTSKTKRQGRGKRRATMRHANTFPAVLEGFSWGEKMRDDVNLKFDDIDATSNGDPNLVACEIDHDMLGEHDTVTGDNCLKKNVDRDKGSLQTQKHGTLRTVGSPTGKKQYSHARIPPPLPRRVQTTPEEVSKAFGLKTSRSGRLLVPPLAHWCNQTAAYDLVSSLLSNNIK